MGGASNSLVARVDQPRPFDFYRRDLLPLWIEAANERLAERRAQIPALAALAKEHDVDQIERLDQLVPLLFSHETYKSYPRAFIDRGNWAGLTRWLNTVSTSQIEGVDLEGVGTQDEWLAAMARAGYPIYGTSGTSGKSSFLPATPADRTFTMRCILRSVEWQFGIKADGTNVVLVLASSQGSSRATEYYRNFASAYGDPARTWFLTDEPVLLAELTRMASLWRAVGEGVATPSEIAAFESDTTARRARLDEAWERLADRAESLEGQQVIIQGFWAQQWTLVERLRARGVKGVALGPGSFLGTGGGTKGADLPEDYEQQIADFWGIPRSMQAGGYGMSELSTALPLIGDRYRLQPWVIPLILNEEGTELLDADEGQHEGRFAFLDLALEGRWGGLISGDRVVADYDTPSISVVPGSVMRYSDLRGGSDDRLTCAGTVDAFVRGFASEESR
jgi:hypothetical protein